MKTENLRTTKIHQLVRKSLMILAALLMVACSSDDSDGSTSSVPDGVPTGLIVPESERAFVLTGSNEGVAGLTSKANGKTWKYDFGEFLYSDSCGEEDEDNNQGNLFLTFKSNGSIEYSNENGVFTTRTYEWGPSKDYVLLDGNNEVKFFFSELNNNQVVYYSEQSVPNSNCTLTTYEVLNQPSTE